MEQAQTIPAHEHNTDSKARRLASNEIFSGEKQVLIEHGEQEYLLRITRQGKLILTK